MAASKIRSDHLWWHVKHPPALRGHSARDMQYLIDGEFAHTVFMELNLAHGGEVRTMVRCPQCGACYFPDLPRGMGDKEQREQHLTHVCSKECWADYLGLEDTELDVVRHRVRIRGIQRAVLA